jgi:glycosyltransferase involved in cell wall biosynthesis
MDISVVICTRNRAKHLPKMLESLRLLSAPGLSWELVFVDNGSTDATAQILTDFCAGFDRPARVIQERKPGLSTARNTGWKAAEGQLICFTDDDCYPRPDWLVMARQVLEDSETAYVGGRVLLYDQNDAPVTIQTLEETIVFKKDMHIESGYIMGANFSCKKSLLEATGGFDERLGAGTRMLSGEDTDLLVRASLLGFEGRYDPRVVVYHHHRRQQLDEVKKLYSGYAYGRGALSMKTIMESGAKTLYLKNWYWRLRILLRERKFDQCFNEIRGAIRFIAVSKLL